MAQRKKKAKGEVVESCGKQLSAVAGNRYRVEEGLVHATAETARNLV